MGQGNIRLRHEEASTGFWSFAIFWFSGYFPGRDGGGTSITSVGFSLNRDVTAYLLFIAKRWWADGIDGVICDTQGAMTKTKVYFNMFFIA